MGILLSVCVKPEVASAATGAAYQAGAAAASAHRQNRHAYTSMRPLADSLKPSVSKLKKDLTRLSELQNQTQTFGMHHRIPQALIDEAPDFNNFLEQAERTIENVEKPTSWFDCSAPDTHTLVQGYKDQLLEWESKTLENGSTYRDALSSISEKWRQLPEEVFAKATDLQKGGDNQEALRLVEKVLELRNEQVQVNLRVELLHLEATICKTDSTVKSIVRAFSCYEKIRKLKPDDPRPCQFMQQKVLTVPATKRTDAPSTIGIPVPLGSVRKLSWLYDAAE